MLKLIPKTGFTPRNSQMLKKITLLMMLAITFVNSAYSQTNFGGQTMVGDLKKVLVRKPDESFGNADPKLWHYTAMPNLNAALKEHEDFVAILKKEGVQVIYHDKPLENHADAIFVHDPALITDKGAIILKMGKPLRQGEEAAMMEKFKSLGIPILFQLNGNARAEAGDILWLDNRTLAIGRGFRTNQQGINQIKNGLAPFKINVVQVDLPYDQGKEACLHLQSLISLVDRKKALVFLKYLPVSFVELLKDKGFTLIEVPENEFSTMGPNVLAIKPNVCLTIQGNVETKKRLEANAVKVYTYQGDEISLKAEGGATCLTRPILRKST
jgi:N-dimethylarginine dimethylaminohydrolase